MKAEIQAFFKTWILQSPRDQLVSFFWILGPFLAMLGNTASDIWLSLGALSLLAWSSYEKSWSWTKERWMIAAVVFWAWMLLTAMISQWPNNSIKEAVTFIRFPIFGMAFALFVGSNPNRLRFFVAACVLSVFIVMPILLYQRSSVLGETKLYGTWGQSTKFGWFVSGFGLPAALYIMASVWRHQNRVLGAIMFAALVVWLTVITGDIYISLSAMLGLALFIVFAGFGFKLLVFLALGGAISFGGMAIWAPSMLDRFLFGITNRLPWLPQSDYYDVWVAGWLTFLQNPLLGVGPDNYEAYCSLPGKLEEFGVDYCLSHPHQFYIQVLAETGVPGLVLVACMVAMLFITCLNGRSLLNMPPEIVASFSLLTVAFWPISTYSNAFGQHKNFFTWLMVAIALALVRSYTIGRKQHIV